MSGGYSSDHDGATPYPCTSNQQEAVASIDEDRSDHPMISDNARHLLGSPTATAAWALSNLCNAPSAPCNPPAANLDYSAPPGHHYPPVASSYRHWPPYASAYYSYPQMNVQPPFARHQVSPSLYSNYAMLPTYNHTTPNAQDYRAPNTCTEGWHSISPTAGLYRRSHIKLPTIKKCQPSPPVETEQLQKKSTPRSFAPIQPRPTTPIRYTAPPSPPVEIEQNQNVVSRESKPRSFAPIEPRPTSPISHNAPSSSESSKRKATPNSLVTPTPTKKAQVVEYSRKTKSLGLLCANFITREWHNGILSIDEAAKELEVERRRIYDIVNILESLQVVVKLHKNTYEWKGLTNMETVIGIMQEEALIDFPELAHKFGLAPGDPALPKSQEVDTKKSLGKLSRQFLQLFLVGCPSLSLHDASDFIFGESTVADLSRIGGADTSASPKSTKAAATKGLKTKIRRLYDIANILCSLGLVRKLDGQRSKHVFVWAYSKSVLDLKKCHDENAQTLLSPQTHEASRVLANMMPPRTVTLDKSPTQMTNNILANIHEHGACETPCLIRSVSLHPNGV